MPTTATSRHRQDSEGGHHALLARRRQRPCYVGDARDVLADMPDGSADCIVTSPPYWAKRDYGVAGQYGHEPDPAAYVATLRAVFARGPPRPGRRRHVLAEPRRLLLGRRRGSRPACTPTSARTWPGGKRPGMRRQEPARPALAGRVRPPGRRLDPAQRDRLAQAQRHARIGPRPAQLPVRADLPAGQVSPHYWFDLDPIRIPHATASPHAGHARAAPARRPRRAAASGGARATAQPGRCPRRRSTARTPGRSSAASRYGTGRRRRGPPPRPQPRRRVVDPDPSLPGTALRRLPDRPARCAASRPDASQAARCSTRSAAPAPPAWPPSQLGRRFTGIELSPAFAALAAERLRHAAARHRTATTASGNDRHAAAGDPACRTPAADRHGGTAGRSLLPAGDKSPAHALPNARRRRTIAGPQQGRAALRAAPSAGPAETRQVRVELPDEPPQLTPAAARALLRILLKAHAARHGEEGDRPVTGHARQ